MSEEGQAGQKSGGRPLAGANRRQVFWGPGGMIKGE